MADNAALIIFTHYGDTDYLRYTLRQVTKTNREMRRVLIGDEHNRKTTISSGWEHYLLDDFPSEKRDLFNARFRWIQGPLHNPIKGRRDWLRFVFERFFCVETFLLTAGYSHFWHFDSDTMILHRLDEYASDIEELGVECTTLCNDICPSGLIKSSFLSSYNDWMIDSFRDPEELRLRQKEYDEERPAEAYTEMPAFCEFRSKSGRKTVHLATAFQARRVRFDDYVCQEHSFDTFQSDITKQTFKALRSDFGRVVCTHNGDEIEFATINCSWAPIAVYEWIEMAAGQSLPPNMRQLRDYMRESLPEKVIRTTRRMMRRLLR
jgi:hypothetical protein